MHGLQKLNRRQLDKLSDIFSDIGLVTLASLVLPALFDKVDLLRLVLGVFATLTFWAISLILKK